MQLPFAILPVLKVTSSAAIMGPYRNNKCMLYTTWGLGVAIVFINFYLAVDFVQTTLDSSVSTIVGVSLFGLCYLALVAYLTWKPIGALPRDHRASLLHGELRGRSMRAAYQCSVWPCHRHAPVVGHRGGSSGAGKQGRRGVGVRGRAFCQGSSVNV